MDINGQIVAVVLLLVLTFGDSASKFKNGHPYCRGSGNDTFCECSGNGLVSTLCDLSALPNNVFFINLGTLQSLDGMSRCGTTSGTAVLDPSAVPVARETHLQVIRLCNFDLDAGGSERVNLWLDNVKHSLEQLFIQQGKLTTLSARFLAGFEGLEVLSIVHTGLKLIEPDAFSQMGARPILRSLWLTGNKLVTFDWAHLRIVAPTLGSVGNNLGNNSISTMETTSTVDFPKLSFVDLQGNSLTMIPLSILYMWANATPNARYKTVNLQRNPLCPTEECRCSSLIPQITFNQDPQNRTLLRMGLNCGNVGLIWESTDPYNLGNCYRKREFGRFLSNCKESSDTEDFSPELAVHDDQTDILRPKIVLEHNYDNFAQ